jgi:hypothetical protein
MEDRPRYSFVICKSGLGRDFLPRCATLNRYATAQHVFIGASGFQEPKLKYRVGLLGAKTEIPI